MMVEMFKRSKFYLSVATMMNYDEGFIFSESNIVSFLAELEEYICSLITYTAFKRDDPQAAISAIPLEKLFTKEFNRKDISINAPGISHLPFVLSASLVNTVAKDPSWRDMKGLAARGFRDTSRLAMGSPAMQRDILLTNREAVTRWLNSCIANLESVRDQLSSTSDDNAATAAWLTQYFSDAQDARAAWEVQRPRSSEMIPEAAAGAVSESFSEHMGRMFFGGFAKKRTPKSSGDGTSSTTSTE